MPGQIVDLTADSPPPSPVAEARRLRKSYESSAEESELDARGPKRSRTLPASGATVAKGQDRTAEAELNGSENLASRVSGSNKLSMHPRASSFSSAAAVAATGSPKAARSSPSSSSSTTSSSSESESESDSQAPSSQEEERSNGSATPSSQSHNQPPSSPRAHHDNSAEDDVDDLPDVDDRFHDDNGTAPLGDDDIEEEDFEILKVPVVRASPPQRSGPQPTALVIDLESRMNDEDTLRALELDIRQHEDDICRLQTALHGLHQRRTELRRRMEAAVSSDDFGGEGYKWSRAVRDSLKQVFGFDQFRELQLQVVNCTMSGHDALVILPTGAGKSLLFQLPAVVQGGLTVVVSPLLSLSRDQVLNLSRRGVEAAMISSDQPPAENRLVLQRIRNLDRNLRLVYVTPESIAQRSSLMSALQAAHRGNNLLRLVIDEVHCCSTMGHDFRPDYKKLFILKRTFKNVPLLAVTATATVRVEEDVEQVLLRDADVFAHWRVFRGHFNRANLSYEVHSKSAKSATFIQDVVNLLLQARFRGKAGIVYCFSRKDTETMAAELSKGGVPALPYHAKLDSTAKQRTHEDWRDGRVPVVCATSAFGMGIDKPDVRFVLHATLPKCMESYIQESGRAGRDGKSAVCILMYRALDAFKVSQLVANQRFGAEKLVEIVRYAEGTDLCRRMSIARAMGEAFDVAQCQRGCDLCAVAQPPQMQNYGLHAESVLRCLLRCGDEVTGNQLIDAWRGVGPNAASGGPFRAPKTWKEEACERLLGNMLVHQLVSMQWSYSAYATITYLRPGEAASEMLRQDPPLLVLTAMPDSMLKKSTASAVGSSSSSAAAASAVKAASGSLKLKSTAAKVAVASTASKSSSKAAFGSSTKPTIELCEGDSDSDFIASTPAPPRLSSVSTSASSSTASSKSRPLAVPATTTSKASSASASAAITTRPPASAPAKLALIGNTPFTSGFLGKVGPNRVYDDDGEDHIENVSVVGGALDLPLSAPKPPFSRPTAAPRSLPTPPRVAPPAAPPIISAASAANSGENEDEFDADSFWRQR